MVEQPDAHFRIWRIWLEILQSLAAELFARAARDDEIERSKAFVYPLPIAIHHVLPSERTAFGYLLRLSEVKTEALPPSRSKCS